MIFPKDWPFKGKPITNSYIEIASSLVVLITWFVLMILYPGATTLTSLSGFLFMCVCAIYRSIRAEWK